VKVKENMKISLNDKMITEITVTPKRDEQKSKPEKSVININEQYFCPNKPGPKKCRYLTADVLSLKLFVFVDWARAQENVYSNLLPYCAVAETALDLHFFFYYTGCFWFLSICLFMQAV
jgi:hypothetical protein